MRYGDIKKIEKGIRRHLVTIEPDDTGPCDDIYSYNADEGGSTYFNSFPGMFSETGFCFPLIGCCSRLWENLQGRRSIYVLLKTIVLVTLI
ncbi:hypothetical protein V6N12_010911 [Hibiscus sabdariffa]|uniref:Uncharacterized protein n=1 Tax=Hibiscus sabdariffa TaxID=183260 RepID=A0ABR2ELH4_9ROSI